MPRKKHIHKYYRRKTGKIGDVWTCGEGCGHYLPRHLEWMIDGRQSICWGCAGEFRIDDDAKEDCLANMEEGIGLLKCSACRSHSIPEYFLKPAPIGEKLSEERIDDKEESRRIIESIYGPRTARRMRPDLYR